MTTTVLEGVLEEWRRGEFLSAWDDLTIDNDGVFAGEDGRHVLLLRLTGRGRGSGMQVAAEGANVVLLRDGRIARLEMFWDREAALRAAGAA